MQENVMEEFPRENPPNQSIQAKRSIFCFFCCSCDDEPEETHSKNFHEQRSQRTTAEACPLIKSTPRNANPPQRVYGGYNDYVDSYFIQKMDRLY